jgi:crotonobetainyl-CoA:carnitine CoA-transferase CaiB-like acyl-CoA transferase
MLGEHVNNVLASWLGMDARSIAALREEGIV